MNRRLQPVKSGASSIARVLSERREVAEALSDPVTKERLKQTVRPSSIAGTMRKAGAALLLAPDPITGIPGAALLAASLVMKRREPSNIESVFREARKLMAELGPLV